MRSLLRGAAGKAGYHVEKMGSPAWVRVRDRLTIVHSGLLHAALNGVFSDELDPITGPGLIAEICAGFNASGVPAEWWICRELSPSFMAVELAKHTFVEERLVVGLLGEIRSLQRLPAPDAFEIHRVQSPEQVMKFGQLLCSVSSPPNAHTLAYYASVSDLHRAEAGPMQLFLGYFHGRAVCTASLYMDGDTAYLFDVSTLSAIRGRGFGKAISRAVLDSARDQGIARVGIYSTTHAMATLLAEGFEQVCSFLVFSNRESLSVPVSSGRRARA